MHSSLVGFLKAVRASSLYLGLTNSPMTPLVAARTSAYGARRKRSWLMLPGKGESPVASSFTSPSGLMVERSSGSSWLYSTFTVMSRGGSAPPPVSLAMAPTACLALRGMASEFTSRPSSTLTPSMAGSVQNARPFVSWKKTTHSTPDSSHLAAVPVECMRACTSPWPWGLDSTSYGDLAAMRASLSMSAATFSCFMSVT
mmetsp:Transcript_16550/g.56294  ORF Transcript_16550/g.56294 Transcript_16550/m.56294 type:complete len:200 (+) Transcript_16550:718-1317(+)